MAYTDDSLLQTFRDDDLMATGYNTFQVAELSKHLCVLHQVWISLASIRTAGLDEWNELTELRVLLCCFLNLN